MEGFVMGTKGLTATRVGKMASKCLLLLLLQFIFHEVSDNVRSYNKF